MLYILLQPTSASSLRRHIAATLFQHHRFVGINGHALQPASLASSTSSLEVNHFVKFSRLFAVS